MMRGQQQAGAFALQPCLDGGDLVGRRVVLSEYVIEPEHHQGVGVGQYPLVDRQSITRLVDALKDRDRVTGYLPGELLEVQRRAVE